MIIFRKIIFLFSFVILGLGLTAQVVLPEYAIAKVKGDEILVRWEPETPQEWRSGMKSGYTVEVLEKRNGQGNFTPLSKNVVKPIPNNQWDAFVPKEDEIKMEYFDAIRGIMITDPKQVQAELGENIEGGDNIEAVDSFLLSAIVYATSFDFTFCELSGLGYKFKIEKGKEYQIKVYPTQKGASSARTMTLNPAEGKIPNVPRLEAEWGDLRVKLKWETKEHKPDFLGYFLELSEDNKEFIPTGNVPYINMWDMEPNVEDSVPLEIEDTLKKNYVTYWYKLKGLDYFGDRTKHGTIISGYGYEKIPIIPLVNESDQTPDNKALIKWSFDKRYERLVKEFIVIRADSLTGEFEDALVGLPPTAREALIPMEHNSNYFRVLCIPKDGKAMSSVPVFIMGQDTIAPATPEVLEWDMDSSGVASIKWMSNIESDFWGYKIFRSNNRTNEFTLITPKPTRDTVFLDTVNINTLTDSIYYQVISLDKRNNRSEFTDIIAIPKPDIRPPVTPMLNSITFENDTIQVTWTVSPSHDVVRYELYRKWMDEEKSWTLLAEKDTSENLVYYDVDYENKSQYAYLVVAIDDADLVSPPSKPKTVFTKSNKPQQVFKDIRVEVDKRKKEARIVWEFKDPSVIENIVVYKGPAEDKTSMLDVIDPKPNELVIDDMKKGEELFFYFHPSLNNGDSAKFSDLIKVELR